MKLALIEPGTDETSCGVVLEALNTPQSNLTVKPAAGEEVKRTIPGLTHRSGLDAAQARLLAPTRPAEELYDLDADPWEIRNLAASPAHREVLERLRGVLDTWIVETNDQGRFPEDPSIPASWDARMKDNYDQRIRDRDRRLGREVPTPLP